VFSTFPSYNNDLHTLLDYDKSYDKEILVETGAWVMWSQQVTILFL